MITALALIFVMAGGGTPPGAVPPEEPTVDWCDVVGPPELAVNERGEVIGVIIVQECVESVNTTTGPVYELHRIYLALDTIDEINVVTDTPEDDEDDDEFVTQ